MSVRVLRGLLRCLPSRLIGCLGLRHVRHSSMAFFLCLAASHATGAERVANAGSVDIQVTERQLSPVSAGSTLSFTRSVTVTQAVSGLQLRLTGPRNQYNILQHEQPGGAGHVGVAIVSGGGLNEGTSIVPGELMFSVPQAPVIPVSQFDDDAGTGDPTLNQEKIAEAQEAGSQAGPTPVVEQATPSTLTYTYGQRVLTSRFQETLEFHLDEPLRAGTRFQLRYGAITAPSAAGDVEYGLAYRVAAGEEWREVPAQRLSVIPGTPSVLTLTPPAGITAGAPFDLWLRVEDDFGNLSGETLPSLQILMNGRFTHTVAETTRNPGLVQGLVFDSPGTGRIEARSAGGQWRATLGPLAVNGASGSRYRTRWYQMKVRSEEAVAAISGADADISVLYGRVLYAPQDQGGHRLVVPGSSSVGEILGVEVPADPRQVTPQGTLAAVVSMTGVHEWRLRQLASRGHRFGVVSEWFRSDSPSLMKPVTGVSVGPGESPSDALLQGRTWVTTGPAIEVGLAVNGVRLGGRAPFTERRAITGFVRGTSPLLDVYLYRNGEPIRLLHQSSHNQGEESGPVIDDAPATPTDTLVIQFTSDSTPAHPLWDGPRNGREWLGYVTLDAGTIERARALGPGGRVEALEVVEGDESRVEFITWTRGTTAGILMEVSGIEENADVRLVLGSGREDGTAMALMRPSATTPGGQYRFRLSGPGGEQRRDVRVDGYTDSIALRWLRDHPDNRANDLTFDLNDFRPRGHGDYYHLVAYQVDGHQAVSSPVWVGGFD